MGAAVMRLSKELKAALTAAAAAIGVVTVPPWFNWCGPAFLGGAGGPPGYICIGGSFLTPWLAIPIGTAIAAGLVIAVIKIWERK